jgi:cysteine desulfurase
MRTLCPELAHNSGEGWWGTILNVSFPEWEGLALTAALDLEGVCIARGAACQSTREVASPAVLSAWPQEKWRADAATRWSLGWASTEAEMSAALESLRRVLATRVICSEGA